MHSCRLHTQERACSAAVVCPVEVVTAAPTPSNVLQTCRDTCAPRIPLHWCIDSWKYFKVAFDDERARGVSVGERFSHQLMEAWWRRLDTAGVFDAKDWCPVEKVASCS
jgi:hypothetical protein